MLGIAWLLLRLHHRARMTLLWAIVRMWVGGRRLGMILGVRFHDGNGDVSGGWAPGPNLGCESSGLGLNG